MDQIPLLDVPAFTILDACDAYDAVDISKPEGFVNGVIAVLLDDSDRPVVALCIDKASPKNLDPIVDFLVEANLGKPGMFSGVVLGLFSPTPTLTPTTTINLAASQVEEWELAECVLAGHGIALLDIVVIDPSGWFAWSESFDAEVAPLVRENSNSQATRELLNRSAVSENHPSMRSVS